jgi:hypothetical protein
MEAWQLLQGNIPSVMGGGATGNSSPAPFAEDIKQNPNKSIPNAITVVSFFMIEFVTGRIKRQFDSLTSSMIKIKYF